MYQGGLQMSRLNKFTILALSGLLCVAGISHNAFATDDKNISTSEEIEFYEPLLNYKETDDCHAGSVHTGYPVKDYGLTDIPSSYIPDIVELPDVRNQGKYGSCWAHSSMALAELSLLKHENITIDLSELHLAYFMYNTETDPLGGTEGDHVGYDATERELLNMGGNLTYSSLIFASWMGPVSEETLPYSQADAVNEGTYVPGKELAYNSVAHLKSAYYINSEDVDEIKKIIMENGGVGRSYYHNESYYNSTHYSYYNNYYTKTNHAVTIVGWNDNFPKANFKSTAPGDGAWLVRNSWGTNGYGLKGYFWISYYDKSLSDTAYAFNFVSSESEEYYDNNYQYDGGVKTSYYYYYDTPTIYSSNIFTAVNDKEVLKAVGFLTGKTNLDYTVNIYKNLTDSNNPESGELVSSAGGSTAFEGFYTVKLDKDVELNKGDVYSVVLKITCQDGSNAYVCYDKDTNSSDWLICTTSAKEGQSYVKREKSAWSDIGISKGNVRIKAFTDNYRSEEIGLSGTRNQDDSYTLSWADVGGYSLLKITGTKFDGTTVNVYGSDKNEGLISYKISDTGTCKSYTVYIEKNGTDSWEETIDIMPGRCHITEIKTVDTGVKIDFSKAQSAEKYIISRKKATDNIWAEIGTTDGNSTLTYIDESAQKGTNYCYKVYSLNGTSTNISSDIRTTMAGWFINGNNWFYADSAGEMVTGWVSDGGKWYYMNKNGAMMTGWVSDGGKWYYMNKSGAMVTGWVSDGGKWYYMNKSGAMVTGWLQIGGKWYFFESGGVMAANKWINNYYMKADGSMAVSEWVDGGRYYVGADGKWIPGKKK